MCELAGGKSGLCKAPRAPELQYRAALMQYKFPGWVWLGCDLSVWAGERGSVCTPLCKPAP